jgi:putative exporter of polyketide antibiotics
LSYQFLALLKGLVLASMKSLLITVAGIVLGLVASLSGITWLAIFSTVIALIGSYAQYKDASPNDITIACIPLSNGYEDLEC